MSIWQDVQIANRDLKQVEFELNRKLRQIFSSIDPNQINGGLPDFSGILPLSKGGTGQNLGTLTANAILFYDLLSSAVAWLYPGSNINIDSGVLDTIQDIGVNSTPIFAGITTGETVGEYAYIDGINITIYNNGVIIDTILLSDLLSIATERRQVDISGIITAGTVFNILSNGTNYTVSGGVVYLGIDITTFNGNINTVVLYNGVELIKNVDVVYVTDHSLSFPNITFDSGDTLVIKGGNA
jgi:hypothetical protein